MLLTYFVRVFTLSTAMGGLIILCYYIYESFPSVNPETLLCITIPDMLLFYLAYKTYPEEERVVRHKHGF
jgi:hypothetical protein